MEKSKLKVALVQDWLTELGGAEKVFATFLELYPEADIYTLTSQEGVIRELKIDRARLTESFIASLPFGRRKYRFYLSLFPKAIESFDLSSYDIVISSSYSVAKGVLTNSNQLHICYCHSPARYAWDLYHQYLRESGLNGVGLKGWYARHVLHKIRLWDQISTNRVDYFIANSNYIKSRIYKVYRRESEVIYPPVDIQKFNLVEEKDNYYFTASRMVPYKRIDLIVQAFNKMSDRKLIVAGSGPDFEKVQKIAGPNIDLMGYVSDEEMISLMSKAKAFVFAADEDFGILPVEAQACGTPVICLGKGGTKETVLDGVTGVHFLEQSENAIIGAVTKFEDKRNLFEPIKIRKIAERFASKRFELEIKNFVQMKMEEFAKQRNL